jgi:hypothetical protein
MLSLRKETFLALSLCKETSRKAAFELGGAGGKFRAVVIWHPRRPPDAPRRLTGRRRETSPAQKKLRKF